MLKATAAAITPVMTKLFNSSISTGSFPQAAKSSVVVPVPKSTDHTLPSNYWPISLLAILSKVLEKYICSLGGTATEWSFCFPPVGFSVWSLNKFRPYNYN